jgi:outer membrane protein assembly factor BamE (lipoprotein component of BamABCDE complex)
VRLTQRGIISVVRLRASLLAALFALVLPTYAGALVNAGTIQVNRGAAGIRLGMTRATVVSKLGAPIFQNGNGYMQYSENNIFDLYLNHARRVRMLGVSGPNFCTASAICMFEANGVRKLKNQWGSRLKLVRLETGEQVYALRGIVDGRRVFTSFSATGTRLRSKIIMVFIGRCPPLPAVCGL